jgi:hypothetical protein
MEVSLFIRKYVHTSVQHEYKSGDTYFPKLKKVHKDPQILLATIQNVVSRLCNTQDLCIPDTESEVAT